MPGPKIHLKPSPLRAAIATHEFADAIRDGGNFDRAIVPWERIGRTDVDGRARLNASAGRMFAVKRVSLEAQSHPTLLVRARRSVQSSKKIFYGVPKRIEVR